MKTTSYTTTGTKDAEVELPIIFSITQIPKTRKKTNGRYGCSCRL
jgi:hypothetical protein